MIKEDIFLLFYECPITLFSLLMKWSLLIELGNTLCCLNILSNSQSHFFCRILPNWNIENSMQTVNFKLNFSFWTLERHRLSAARVCARMFFFVRGWLQVRVTVGGWVAASRRVLWFVCVGALRSCWDLLEGKQGNMYFNPWVYCHSKKPIKFYDLAAGGSFPCAWRARLIYIDVSSARHFQRASIHGMLTGLTYLVSI